MFPPCGFPALAIPAADPRAVCRGICVWGSCANNSAKIGSSHCGSNTRTDSDNDPSEALGPPRACCTLRSREASDNPRNDCRVGLNNPSKTRPAD